MVVKTYHIYLANGMKIEIGATNHEYDFESDSVNIYMGADLVADFNLNIIAGFVVCENENE